MPEATPRAAVSRYDGPRSTAELQVYSQTLAVNTTPDGKSWRNEALPATFRGNPAAVAFAVEYAKALDVSPVTALIGIHIVDGKPTASAGLISALIRRAGHMIRTWLEGSIDDGTAKAITTIVRCDDPDFEYRSEWTLSRAVRAELMKRTADGRIVAAKPRSAWSTYPENMLKARSVTECARDAAEDAILGVHYTPEELGAEVDANGDVVYSVTQVPTPAAAPETTPTPETRSGTADAAPAGGETDNTRQIEDTVEWIRRLVFDARSADEITAAWKDANAAIVRIVGEGTDYTFRDYLTADANDVETNLLDLFGAAGEAIKSGSYLAAGTRYDDPQDGTGDADGDGPDEDPGDDGNDPESGDSDSGEGRELTVDEVLAKVDNDGDVVDAEIVEDETPESGAENDTRAAATEEANGSRPAPSSSPEVSPTPHRAALDRVMNGLSEGQVQAVVSYCRLNGLNPANGEDHSRAIVDAIKAGDAFTTATRPDDPVALVAEILGGTVVSDTPHRTVEERHEAELANNRAAAMNEDREDARRATSAGHGDRGNARAAYEAARAAGRK